MGIANIIDRNARLPEFVGDHMMLLTTPGAAWKYIVMWDQVPDHQEIALSVAKSLGSDHVQEFLIGDKSIFVVFEIINYAMSLVH